MTPTFQLSATLTLVTALAACGGPSAAPASHPTSTPDTATTATADSDAEPAPTALPADLAWPDMNDDQKAEYMRQKVLPNMESLFKEIDPEEFAQFTCDTCHGEGAEDKGELHMPNPQLPKLDPAGGFAADKEKHPKMTEAMMQRVVPTMAVLLNTQPYNPATQKGFGCFDCHTHVE